MEITSSDHDLFPSDQATETDEDAGINRVSSYTKSRRVDLDRPLEREPES